MNYLSRAATCLILLTSAALSYSQKVTPEQRAKHPCLDKVSGAAEESVVKLSDIPESMRGLAPVYIGHWNEPNGTKVCTALLIRSIGSGGQGAAVYTNDEPYKRTHAMGLAVKREGDRFNIDVYHRSQGWNIEYVSEDGGKTLVMRPAQGYRGPAKTGELVAVE